MNDESDWSIDATENEKEKNKPKSTTSTATTQRGGGRSNKITSNSKNEEDQKNFKQQEEQNDKFISNNILDDQQLKNNYSFYDSNKDHQTNEVKKVELSMLSMIHNEDDNEDQGDNQLKPDKKIVDLSMWNVEADDNQQNQKIHTNQKQFGSNQRGNRNKRQEQPVNEDKPQRSQQPKRRGNRQSNTQSNKPYYNPVHQVPDGRNNRQNNHDDNNQERSGRGNRVFSGQSDNEYQGRGRGRGRGRGGYNNYNSHRDYQDGQRNNNNWKSNTNNYNQTYSGGDFKKKPTFQQRQENQTQSRDNNHEYVGRGAYRGRGDYRGGYRGRGGSNNYNDRNNDRNNDNNNNGERRNYYNNNNNRYNNYNQPKKQPEVIIKEVTVEKEVIKEVIKEVQVFVEPPKSYPKGRKCWPSQSIIILGCKLTVTYRKIQSFKNDILVVPYRQPKLDLYPGNFVMKSTADYKKKITDKGEKLLKDGSVYIQKSVGIDNFKGFAFLKIMDVQKSIKNGIKQLLRQIGKLKSTDKQMRSIVFPISKQLGDPKVYLKEFCDQIQNFSKVEQIIITTQVGQLYCKVSKCLNEIIQGYMQENQVTIY